MLNCCILNSTNYLLGNFLGTRLENIQMFIV